MTHLTRMAGSAVLSLAVACSSQGHASQSAEPSANSSQTLTTTPAPSVDFRHQFAVAAKAISPAVVSVTSKSRVQRPSFRGTPFEFFFGGPGASQGGGTAIQHGIGSGVVIDS